MSEYSPKAYEYQLVNAIKKYWRGYGVIPKIVVVADPIVGYVVRSNMLNGKPTKEDRPVYLPQRDITLGKRL